MRHSPSDATRDSDVSVPYGCTNQDIFVQEFVIWRAARMLFFLSFRPKADAAYWSKKVRVLNGVPPFISNRTPIWHHPQMCYGTSLGCYHDDLPVASQPSGGRKICRPGCRASLSSLICVISRTYVHFTYARAPLAARVSLLVTSRSLYDQSSWRYCLIVYHYGWSKATCCHAHIVRMLSPRSL